MKYISIALLATLACLSACQPKSPSPAAASDTAPVATVNGTPITREFFEFYIKGITNGKKPSDLTKEQRERALDTLVRAELVGQQAETDGTTKDPDIIDMLALQRLNVLQGAESEKYLKDKKPTEQELRAEYETQIALLPHQEYHARHILVATEPFAKKLIGDLEKGANFADLAKRESMDSSKDNGGDLGWMTPSGMVKPFADAVLALKPGEYTHSPVQTQYGWHIVELVETRDLAVPSFDSVHQRLEQMVAAKKFEAYADELLKNAKVVKTPEEAPAPSALKDLK